MFYKKNVYLQMLKCQKVTVQTNKYRIFVQFIKIQIHYAIF